MLRPFPFSELDLGHGGHRARGSDDALGFSGGAAGIGDGHDVTGGQRRDGQRLRIECGCGGDDVVPNAGQLVGYGTEGEDPGESVDAVEQFECALDELGDRVDHQRRHTGIAEDVGVVVDRTQRVQRGAPPALRLPGTDHQQHLGTIQRQQADRRTRCGPDGLECLDVSADLLRHLFSGQLRRPETQHGPVGVPGERGGHEVTEVHTVMQWHRGRDDRFGDDEGCGVRGRGVRSRGVHDHQTRTCFSFCPEPSPIRT